MEQLIPIVNKLQDVFGAIGQYSIDLPQITVVGSQSAGKSSVLENIVGRDFLPRGSGVVTRRPLILQLYSLAGEKDLNPEKSEWGEFLHLPGQRFYNFSEIREEIVRDTERITGKNKGISNKSINLKIYSPHVLNLTLVDLPGITKVPTGDQPEDIEEKIREMCMEFISKPNAIILAVSAANQDLVNSEGLKLARTVDPDGLRTIGVLTKVDIMDHGTDATDILQNKVIPLRRGYIAVVNRSQKDIQDGLAIRDGLAKEQTFFLNHAKYGSVLGRTGTTNLAKTLNTVLMSHIRDCLPDIKMRITSMVADVQLNLDTLGEPFEGDRGLSGVLLNILSRFATNFSNAVQGAGTSSNGVEMMELVGGARVSYIFNEIFGRSLRPLDPFDELSDDDIRTAIANANGPRAALFVPEVSFDLLVKRQISRLEQPGQQCVDYVFDEMQRMAYQSEPPDLSRFPLLREKVLEVVNSLLRKCVLPTQKMIANLIQIELAYINTSHPDFIGGKQAVAQLNRKVHQNAASSSAATTPAAPAASVTADAPPNPPPSSSPAAATTLKPFAAATNGGDLVPPTVSTRSRVESSSSGNISQQRGGFASVVRLKEPGATPGRSDGPSSTLTKGFSNGLKLASVPDRMRPMNPMSDRERVETEIVKSLIASYFEIVKKNYLDLVPKTIMHFLVNAFKDGLQNELVSQLYKGDMVTELMQETADIAERRKSYRELKGVLLRAMEIVNEVRDFNTFK